MPPPYLAPKPHQLVWPSDGDAAVEPIEITEYEQADALEPGCEYIASHLLKQLGKLLEGEKTELSRALLAGNPAWPPELRDAAKAGRVPPAPLALLFSLALSRTQDDKGNTPWTLFGTSHEGAGPPFWRSFGPNELERLRDVVAWATRTPTPSLDGVRVLDAAEDVPEFARPLILRDDAPLAGTRIVLTFRAFGTLPPAVRGAFLAGELVLLPHPVSLIFFEHPGYARLAQTLPRARQIPLLHLFPRVEGGCSIRIPQSGWLDEVDDATAAPHGHKIVRHVVRTHRWQRAQRDAGLAGDGSYTDDVSVALFSSDADDLGLYGKPMARNAQIWREDYQLLLDGPSADALDIENAAAAVDRGGRFGYRFFYPPMRLGMRELFWHRPLVARVEPDGSTALLTEGAPEGYVLAELPGEAPIELEPRRLDRAGHREAARFRDHPGRPRNTTGNNARKLLELAESLGTPLCSSLARAALHVPRDLTLEAWLAGLEDLALARHLGELLGPPVEPGLALTFRTTANREFEEQVWRTIASLAEGPFRNKENADVVAANHGRHGGPAAKAAEVQAAHRRDLARLGDDLHERHRKLVEKHGMQGRARIADHRFRWQTHFDMSWSEGWASNQSHKAHERNIVVVIPGRNRGEAVIMGDHYDTAYMEDVYEEDRGGDGLRVAAAGADDNHSATTALLLAADVLLPLAREGRLERDVWLVHLTGEEFPSDCLGARALAQGLLERRLRLFDEDGAVIDVSGTRVVGAFILDMIGHNNPRDRDVFQIAPGEGAAASRLAALAHAANVRWNREVVRWNAAPGRNGLGRAERREHGRNVPPPFAHLTLHGELRPEWDPRSALYNTDGQIFSDVGIPVVLFMENYDISRTGYHDTHDTMKNIDLDYAAALTAIAIETVAQTAAAEKI
ncbi:MAG TPA: M28 family peptidase [Polyangia bacterium]|nr:M28 family peptidase [Polyangia bacterium]